MQELHIVQKVIIHKLRRNSGKVIIRNSDERIKSDNSKFRRNCGKVIIHNS